MSLADHNYGMGDTTLGNPPDLFELLCKYHVKENLKVCLPHIRADGNFYPEGKEIPLPETHENEAYRGFMLIAVKDMPVVDDKSLSMDEFVRELLVDDYDVADPFVGVNTTEELFKYINDKKEKDGAYVFNMGRNEIARVYEIKNGLQKIDYSKVLPADFIHQGAKALPEKIRGELGTKTPLAIKIPHKFKGVETYLIKKTAYGSTGMGKVVHFSDELVEEMYFEYERDDTGRAEDKPEVTTYRDIVAVYKKYESVDGKLTCVEERRNCVADIYGDESMAAGPDTKAINIIHSVQERVGCSAS